MFDFFKRKKQPEEPRLAQDCDTGEAVEPMPPTPTEPEAAAESATAPEPKRKGFFKSLREGLIKTRSSLNGALDNLFHGKATIDDDLFDEIEELLITSDIGFETTMQIIDRLRDTVAERHIRDTDGARAALIEVMKSILRGSNVDTSLKIEAGTPTLILVIGVNGVGKTTTIGKLASRLKQDGKRVMLAAADTFRAAAIDQLDEWAHRAGVDIVKRDEGADPASVIYDAIHSAKAKGVDVLICDTAGRLHNKKNLMNELEKINRIINREFAEANRESLIVLDATTGQNAIAQAKAFGEVTDITGIVLTKLDGTAKGGVVYPLQLECNASVKYIGIGEGIEDLRAFDPDDFVTAIFE